ncbi:MAG: GNAT family N-acetyltransferase [Ktedonobacterales bacterium]
MVTLRPMTEEEFAAFKAKTYEDYAEERASVEGADVERERENARKQIDDLMVDGLRSEVHHYWKAVAPGDGVVGELWVFVDDAQKRAFIYFIGTDEAYRGKGYGQQTLEALEAAMRPLGVRHIALNVFGANTTARRLYERMGYQPQAILMSKSL